jgi:hypothetical protein
MADGQAIGKLSLAAATRSAMGVTSKEMSILT